ncbi:MAG TPA: choice-of-anchor Q domain-containing protein [Thermomicrobiales bacterium]|nr:choice-of-anchor Q domain-containing protein [Thermomicrobiales bacterium]
MQSPTVRRTRRMLVIALLLGLLGQAGLVTVWADDIVVADGDVYGANGLVAAIEQANASGEPTTIILAEDGDYPLTAGQLLITGNAELTIEGNGSTIRRDTQDGFRVMQILSGASVAIDHLTISNGMASGTLVDVLDPWLGGGVYNSGTLTLANSAISSNTALGWGGGIYNDTFSTLTLNDSIVFNNSASDGDGGGVLNLGTLTLNDSIVSVNRAFGGGGGIIDLPGIGGGIANGGIAELNNSTVSSNLAFGGGGGIVTGSFSTLSLLDSGIHDNRALGDLGGGGVLSHGVVTVADSVISRNTSENGDGGGVHSRYSLSLSGSVISDNTASGSGGGVYAWGSLVVDDSFFRNLTVSDSVISGNTADDWGGGIDSFGSTVLLTESTVNDNRGGLGGGIGNRHGALTVSNSVINDNYGRFTGGGIANYGDGAAELTNSTVSGNHTLIDGGGIYNFSTLTVTASTISGNHSALLGGGIISLRTLTVTNSTVSGNTAAESGGGLYNGGTLTLTHGTISDNSANIAGGGIYNENTLILHGTLVAGNTAPAGPDLNGAVTTDHGYNLIGDDSDMSGLTGATNQLGDGANPIDQMLGPLQDNGGPTETMALLPGSPALNVIPPASCTLDVDQRGVERPSGAGCDVGAFELDVEVDPPDPPAPPVGPDFTPKDDIDNPAFLNTWARTDLPVRDGHISRTWMWGPGPFTVILVESYVEAPGGLRIVIYFDKARMEITAPDADPDSIWYVTNGLLVVEMMTGMRQFGHNTFVDRGPAAVNVAGDANDPDGPTYASFAGLLALPAQPVGTLLVSKVDRDGNVTVHGAFSGYGVDVAHVDEVTSHGIARPFWEFMNSQGLVHENGQMQQEALFESPVYATGRPITEPYWATVLVDGGPRDVLIQCFERRCLTYTPGNPDGFVVEAGNVGQHYYLWRYFLAVD